MKQKVAETTTFRVCKSMFSFILPLGISKIHGITLGMSSSYVDNNNSLYKKPQSKV
jgi:hypothetical protein